ncbi:hypothetical protein IP90_02284 [Luteimonas cucumeris]|uniref:Uncharacterized protein n=1 Tax=Luteimonas cucumeris TaxID=985012 RepID=A0A562L2N5_9GAMM|nr:hypothetical protein [Luteimonas cucumeris]TWI01724.1 hypothetical protein IP90_02284 [Luteimonas cucumeris]
MRKPPRPRNRTLLRAPPAASPAALAPALSLMQQLYDLDAALARKQRTALSIHDIYDEWHAHDAVIRQARRRRSRAWAAELLQTIAVRHGIGGWTNLSSSPGAFWMDGGNDGPPGQGMTD